MYATGTVATSVDNPATPAKTEHFGAVWGASNDRRIEYTMNRKQDSRGVHGCCLKNWEKSKIAASSRKKDNQLTRWWEPLTA